MQLARRPYPVYRDDLAEDALALLHPTISDKPDYSSSGSWMSADGLWAFRRIYNRHWAIMPIENENDMIRARRTLLDSVGLSQARFPTRRAAIAALDLALADATLTCG